jgi:lysozyme family protein
LYDRKKQFYAPVEKAIGVPWYMVAVIDQRESGARGGVLHNGEFIVGKGRRTSLVPANRGPFNTWHEAAIDALTMPGKNFDKVGRKNWSIELVLYALEAYNGWGYRQYHSKTPSPYVWSCTNVYDDSPRGKYIADGVWGAGVTDTQIGCAPLLKALLALDKSTVVPSIGTTGAVVVSGTIAATQAPIDWMPYIVGGTVLFALTVGAITYWYQKRIKPRIK